MRIYSEFSIDQKYFKLYKRRTFKRYLVYLIRQKKLTKAAAARSAKVSEGYIYALVKGLKPVPTYQGTLSLSKALKCTPSEQEVLLRYSFDRILHKWCKRWTRPVAAGGKW